MCVHAAGMLQRLIPQPCTRRRMWHPGKCSVPQLPGAYFRIYVTALHLYREVQGTPRAWKAGRAGQPASGVNASASTNARAAVAAGVRAQSPTIRITNLRLVTEKFWFSPAPRTADVTVCVVDSGQ
jgi:hypothetical protein